MEFTKQKDIKAALGRKTKDETMTLKGWKLTDWKQIVSTIKNSITKRITKWVQKDRPPPQQTITQHAM